MATTTIKVYQAGKEFIQLLANDASEETRDKAFEQAFVQPHSRCFSNGNSGLLYQLVANLGMFDWKTVDLDELARTIDELDKFENELEQTVNNTLERCQAALPFGQDLSVWILPGDGSADHLRDLKGLSAAFSEESGGIRVVIYPVENWLTGLPYVLTHEYHHAVYISKNGNPRNLLELLVVEGLADSFANSHYPNTYAPWLSPDFLMTADEERMLYKSLLKNKDKDSPNLWGDYLNGPYFAGGTKYAGRAIAYRLVQGFKSLHDLSITHKLGLLFNKIPSVGHIL